MLQLVVDVVIEEVELAALMKRKLSQEYAV
jgi:hypothetical protein